MSDFTYKRPVQINQKTKKQKPNLKIKFEKKDAKSKRKHFLILFLMILVPILVIYVLFFSNFLLIKSYKISGVKKTSYVDKNQIKSKLNEYINKRIATINIGNIEKEIIQDQAIASVDVSTKWPSTIIAKVKERKPIGIIVQNDKWILIDKDLNKIKYLNANPGNLPLLNIPLDNKVAIQNALNVLSVVSTKFKNNIQTVVSPTQDSLTFYLKSPAKIIIWGDLKDSTLKEKDVWTLINVKDKIIDVTSASMPITRKS